MTDGDKAHACTADYVEDEATGCTTGTLEGHAVLMYSKLTLCPADTGVGS